MKHIIRSTLSTFFYLISFLKKREGIIVLTYHRVNNDLPPSELNISADNFRSQMKYLKEHCMVIGIEELITKKVWLSKKGNRSKPIVVITFDDGYRDNYLNAYPVLKEYSLPACVFLITDMIGTSKKRARYKDLPDPDMLTWQEVDEMAKNDITFCSHTKSHHRLSQLNRQQQMEEIEQGITMVGKHLIADTHKDIFCYPYGDYNTETLETLKELGVRVAFTVKPGTNNENIQPLEMQRTEISGVDSLFDFRKKLAGGFDWMHEQIQKRKNNVGAMSDELGAMGSMHKAHSSQRSSSKALSKINVLHVICSLGLGGGEQTVIHLINGMDKNSYRHFLCCLDDEGIFADAVRKECKKIYALNKKRGVDFSVVGRIMQIIKENNISIVHTHMWGGNVWGRTAAKLAGVPIIIATEQNVDVWKKWYHKMIDKCLSLFTDKIVIVSKEIQRFCEQEMRIPTSKFRVIYNCVPSSEKVPDANYRKNLLQELKIPDNGLLLANIGRLVPQKANHIFIEALDLLDKNGIGFAALIIGDGPLQKDLEEKGKPLIEKGKLVFTGLRKDIAKILDITDIFVLSSTREGSSVAMCEAMHKGIPIVATNVSGNDEQIIHEQTGFLVPVNDPQSLAKAIARLIQDPLLGKLMGQNAQRRARECFSVDRMVHDTEALYKELLNAKR